MSKPRKDLDEKDIERIARLSAMGVPERQIAAAVDMSVRTFQRRKVEDEGLVGIIEKAKSEANHNISQSLYAQAMSGNVTAAIFWCKTQMGWRETSVIEHQGKDGGPMQYANMNDEQLMELLVQTQVRLAELASGSAGSDDGSENSNPSLAH